MDSDRVSPVFKGRHLFLTGGTGFLGKTFIEKLLRVTEVEKIYLLIRFKKGKPPRERLLEVFRNPLFDLLKKQMNIEEILSKFVLIEGDVSLVGLGLSDDDRKLVADNVTLIYHAAATIRFDEKIKKAVELNTRGTQEMLKLAFECKKLEMFCYVSTAYAYVNEAFLFEKPYDPPTDPHKLIKSVELLQEDEVERMKDDILGLFPNSYSFTKALAESLVWEAVRDRKLPGLIVRPSIVIPTMTEPMPGWTDNLNGPAGLLIAAGKGVLRTIYNNPKSYGDFLPVDIAINGLIVNTWYYLTHAEDFEFPIMNFTSSQDVQISWEEIIDMGRVIVDEKYPMGQILWYPGGGMTRIKWLHKFRSFFFQWMPAVLLDILIFCIGMKPFMWRVQKRIARGIDVLTYYASNQWDFDDKNQILMRSRMNKTELKKYKVDAEGIDVYNYFEKTTLGVRRYLLNRTDDMLPADQRTMRIMYWLDKICKTFIYGWLLYWLSDCVLSLFLSPKELSDFYHPIRQMFGREKMQSI